MKLSFFLVVFLACLGGPLLTAQNSEEEKIFLEATESRFNDPYKSLKLYDYLLKNASKEEAVAIKIKKLQINRLLGEYEEAVAIAQAIENSIHNYSIPNLQFEYFRELATLFSDLDLRRNGKTIYEKAKNSYENLNPEAQEGYAIDLALLSIKYISESHPEKKVARLKNVLHTMGEDDERKPFIQFQVAKLYYPLQKDSSRIYFNRLKNNHKVTPLNQASIIYLNLLDTIKKTDSINFPKVEVNLFDKELNSLLLNETIDYWKEKGSFDSLMHYEKQMLNDLFQTSQNFRKAKVSLIQGIYRQKQIEASAEAVSRTKQLGVAITLVFLIILTYFGYKRKHKIKIAKTSEVDNTKGIVISDKTEEEILEKLKKFENSKLFLDKQLRVASLAKQLDTNTRYLSSIINASKNKSFNAYINSLRIQYIVNKLNAEPKYRTYKISYLAEESGFASQSSFTTAFKEVTAHTPSAYIKKISV